MAMVNFILFVLSFFLSFFLSLILFYSFVRLIFNFMRRIKRYDTSLIAYSIHEEVINKMSRNVSNRA